MYKYQPGESCPSCECNISVGHYCVNCGCGWDEETKDGVKIQSVKSYTKTKFNTWFNIGEHEHIRAYKSFHETGWWPRYFLPADVELEENWEEILKDRIINRYIYIMTSPGIKRPEPKPKPEFS